MLLRHCVVVQHFQLAHTIRGLAVTSHARIIVTESRLHIFHLSRIVPIPIPTMEHHIAELRFACTTIVAFQTQACNAAAEGIHAQTKSIRWICRQDGDEDAEVIRSPDT